MTVKNEAALVTKITKAIRDKYPEAWVFKVVGNPYQAAGVPDILVCVDSWTVGIEVKHQKAGETLQHAFSRVSPQQDVTLRKMSRAGAVCGVTISVEGALTLLKMATGKNTHRINSALASEFIAY